jgi:hypothetical protein
MLNKPKLKKHRAVNNPVPTIHDQCAVCGLPYAHLHEIFYGTANRQISIANKFQVRLCMDHHTGQHGVHSNIVFDLSLKRQAQEEFEKTHTREEFLKLIGRNYL